MIPIERLEEPDVLARNKAAWSAAFQQQRANDPSKRPSSRQYAHQEVKATLAAMSHQKCFYCEQTDAEKAMEVDHFIEVAERPDLAFEWTNLYLSCRGCNDKIPNRSIPVAACVDPCEPGCKPSEHLRFEAEHVSAQPGSSKGLNTVSKFKLNRDELLMKRSRHLRRFNEALIEILKRMNADGGRGMTEQEKALLHLFSQADYPFSLMFRFYLAKHGL